MNIGYTNNEGWRSKHDICAILIIACVMKMSACKTCLWVCVTNNLIRPDECNIPLLCFSHSAWYLSWGLAMQICKFDYHLCIMASQRHYLWKAGLRNLYYGSQVDSFAAPCVHILSVLTDESQPMMEAAVKRVMPTES